MLQLVLIVLRLNATLLEVQHPRQQEQIRVEMMRNVYGSALPARMALEKQILGR